MATYIVPECNLSELESRIEKLNHRCRKLGLAEITISKTPDHVRYRVRQLTVNGSTNLVWVKSVEKTPESELPKTAFLANAFEPTGEVMTWWTVEVNGERPSLADWTFVAILEPMHTEDGETLNLTQCLPGETCPNEFRTRIGECDHCKMIRNRKQTFVVKHTDGSYKCVGRQCIKDFLGYNADPHNLASAAELMAELAGLCEASEDDEWLGGSGGNRERYWDLKHILTLTACRIRLFGWLGRGKARERFLDNATADMVLEILTPPDPRYAGSEEIRKYNEFAAKHTIEDADGSKAEAAIEWAKTIPAAELEDNDYLSNVNLISRVGTVSRKTIGIAASIITAYDRAMENEIKRTQLAARPESNHIGEVGKRIDMLEVTCEKIIRSEGQYGVTGIHKMTDAAGNDLTWFASESAGWIDEGKTVTIAATVKSHGEYKGRKQTVLTRVLTWTEEGLAAAKLKAEKRAAREAKKAAKSVTV